MTEKLQKYISINRRYTRSINLERDINDDSKLKGYIPSDRALNALRRIITGMQSPESSGAWTLTGVYGTGKSAFAHYIASLWARQDNPLRIESLKIGSKALGKKSPEYKTLIRHLPPEGYIRAVATAIREPISHTLIRALYIGIESYWAGKPSQRNNIPAMRELADLYGYIDTGEEVSSKKIIRLIHELAEASGTGVFIIIDELGKCLEYCAYDQGNEDLYLLQQICELPKNSRTPIYILGILHQSFAEYSQRLATSQRNEWAKIQGRFEDIPFSDSPSAMMGLIGQAIDKSKASPFQKQIAHRAKDWFESLKKALEGEEMGENLLESIYPLHPVTALALPALCQRYAQNDRSLFTFLTSNEPYSFQNFLQTTESDRTSLPTLKLDRVYDYFIEAVGSSLASRPNWQRWVEIQDSIKDAKNLGEDPLKALKAIGILNLITTTGSCRATRNLVSLAMCDDPEDRDGLNYWHDIIEQLLNRGSVTYFRQLDELRIWQGSDFNIDKALSQTIELQEGSLVRLLSDLRPLNPIVAQRHSYRTGTLRYFERMYLGDEHNLENLRLENDDSDGLIGYWVEGETPSLIPPETIDQKPFILIKIARLDRVRTSAREYGAFKKIRDSAPELQIDGVARREIRHRLNLCETILNDVLSQAFDFSHNSNTVWVRGEAIQLHSISGFNITLSKVCDDIYSQTPILWNELLNRRRLTSQGTKARRELITAMIENSNTERLGLSGHGAEVSMYYSLLQTTGIHRQDRDHSWGFHPPEETSSIYPVWCAIENFCVSAREKPETLDKLYTLLNAPPYGIKQGMIPVLIAALILAHRDDLGIYQEGTYIPILGAEHFELLVREPSRFAVKYFDVVGSRSNVFKELESILKQSGLKNTDKLRNTTLLTVVTPLYQFVKKLPAYTKQTTRLTGEARAIIKALQDTIEPDELIFTHIPLACKLNPITSHDTGNNTIATILRERLVDKLKEIHGAYDKLLTHCQQLLYEAFGVRRDKSQLLREDIRVRATRVMGKCVERNLKSFIGIAIDEGKIDREWLEALVMVIADKPPASWKDEDVTLFESKLSDLARRFHNLEALQEDMGSGGEGLEARRITVTRADGRETHRVVWVDKGREKEAQEYTENILTLLAGKDEAVKQVVLAKLSEIILATSTETQFSGETAL
ncbi:MAG: hypothetical protein N5P05_003541 [Chroococcopsis gigantea SAG 12.99]|jgi:hypothetical protein|nr:hypothetical protein [Chroococcopsis gigantea SAG 12.99]